MLFQSTPSVWRVTVDKQETYAQESISIHTLRVEGDKQAWKSKRK